MRVEELRRALEEVAGPVPSATSEGLGRVRAMARRRRARRALAVAVVSVAAATVVLVSLISLTSSEDTTRVSVSGPDRPQTGGAGPAIFLNAEGGKVTRVDLGTREQRTVDVPGLFPGDPPFHLLVRGDRLVYWGRTETDGAFATFSIPLDLRGPPQLLDRALFFVPSTHPNRVWLVYDTNDDRRPALVREVTASGAGTVPPTALPPDSYPERGVDGGLLLGTSRDLVVWKPGVGAVRTLGTGLSLDANTSTVAWASDDGRLHVAAVDTGADRLYAPPIHRERFLSGAFSPDGRTFAALVGAPPTVPSRLVLVDLVAGSARIVPGSEIAPNGDVAWSPDGDNVIFTGYVSQPRVEIEVGTYEIGEPAARRINVPTARTSHVTAG